MYSLAVLLLILLGGKYDRPDYAQTSNVNEVYAAINQAKDSDHVSQWMEAGGLHLGKKMEALKIVQTMFNAQRQEGFLMSLMDGFTERVTIVITAADKVCKVTTV